MYKKFSKPANFPTCSKQVGNTFGPPASPWEKWKCYKPLNYDLSNCPVIASSSRPLAIQTYFIVASSFLFFFSSYSSNFSSRSIHFCSVSSFFLFLFSSLFVLMFGSSFASSTPFFPFSLSSYSSSSRCSSLFIYPSLCSWVSSHSSFCALNPHMPTCLTVSLAIHLYIYHLTINANIP